MERYSAKLLLTIILLMTTCKWAFGGGKAFVADTQKFGVRLFLVPDAGTFVEMWSKPETPKLTLFNKAKIDTQFAGAILYWGGGKNAEGECNIQLQTRVLKGNSVLASGPEMPVCQGHPPPQQGVLALSDTMIDLVTSGEPANLVVQVTVTDKVNNETLSVSAPIEVVAD